MTTSDVRITELGTDAAEWDAFVRLAPSGSPYHLTAWKRAVEDAFGHRAHYLMAWRRERLDGVLPLFEVSGLLGGRSLISVPYAVYGGVCAESPETRRALVDAATQLARARSARYIEFRERRDLGLGLPTKSLYVTFARAIAKDPEENARAIPRKQRRMTRQGAKHGLRVEIGAEHFDAFYAIYAQSLRNLGSPVFPKALVRGVHDHFGKDAELLTVWRGERMLAGVLTLYFEDQVLPYYAGALRDGLPYAVNDFMYWELMCRAAERGCRVFDFGRSREGTGPYHFKRHWGFEPVPLPYQYVLLDGDRLPDLTPSNPRLRLATRVWKRLPLPLTNALGPILTRYLPG
ncbi:MAG TPA: FemAB family XrtA/PEP-CTERM system-associated protein [Candidatus Tectomicrobia bacterium]|nr:FemAB family XrtA/PEP-CTERM system-associated protein [Candidatus Tectomicrobia bacterium]